MFVHLYLYTKNAINTPKLLKISTEKDDEVELDPSFDSKKPTKFVIHGFQSNLNSDVIQKIKNAYLQTFDYNVIGI